MGINDIEIDEYLFAEEEEYTVDELLALQGEWEEWKDLDEEFQQSYRR